MHSVHAILIHSIHTVLRFPLPPLLAVGSRQSHLHLLSGGVLPLLSALDAVLLAHADEIGLK